MPYSAGFPLSKLENKTLVLLVLDYDRFSKDDPIGEVEVQLGEVNFYEPNIFHTYLSPCTGDRVRFLGTDETGQPYASTYYYSFYSVTLLVFANKRSF